MDQMATPTRSIMRSHAADLASRESSIDAAERAANLQWLNLAKAKLHERALHYAALTSDEVWFGAGKSIREPRAMGPVMRFGMKMGWIQMTGRVVQSRQGTNHGRDVKLWDSLISNNPNHRCEWCTRLS